MAMQYMPCFISTKFLDHGKDKKNRPRLPAQLG